jgi:hypothetical protein
MEEQAPAAPTISISDIIMNVFASPAEAFEGIRTSPTRASVWLMPLIVLILVTSLFSVMIFTNETLKMQFSDSQSQRLQERVNSGQMTQEQADQQLDGMERMGGMMIAFGIIGTVISMSVIFFASALVLWLVGKFALKAEGGYGKYLELYGTSGWIGILGAIITLLMMVGLGSMYASPSASLAVLSEFKPTDTTHRLLSSINIFNLWQFYVLGVGLAKYSQKSIGTGVTAAAVLWIAWTLVAVFLLGGLGM